MAEKVETKKCEGQEMHERIREKHTRENRNVEGNTLDNNRRLEQTGD